MITNELRQTVKFEICMAISTAELAKAKSLITYLHSGVTRHSEDERIVRAILWRNYYAHMDAADMLVKMAKP